MNTRNEVGDDPALNAQVQLLRSRVEDDLKKPAVVMVTSARKGDGKSLTAHTLAVSFTMQGHRTALVRLCPVPVERGEGWEFLDCGSDNVPVMVELPRYEDGGTTPEKLAVFVDRMRTEYDYTVVDAGAFLSSAPTMTLSRMVDGIMLAIRMGRAPSNDDQSMLKMMEHSRGRVVGVVAIEAEAAGKMRRRKPEERASPPVKVAADSANGKPNVRVWNVSRFFRPDH
jgi:succinoglycan biosynthesis transport protein ExoP